jgi:hypothetical protein
LPRHGWDETVERGGNGSATEQGAVAAVLGGGSVLWAAAHADGGGEEGVVPWGAEVN